MRYSIGFLQPGRSLRSTARTKIAVLANEPLESARNRSLLAPVRHDEEGSTLIEMALSFPLLLMLVTAICAFGVAFNNQLTLTSATGAGAQYLQLIRTKTTDPCADTAATVANAAPNLTAANINLSFKLNGTTVSGNSCAGLQSNLVQGGSVTVTATYPCVLPIYAMKFASGCLLSASVTEYEY